MNETLTKLCVEARDASHTLESARCEKNAALKKLSALLSERADEIISANELDVKAAREGGMSEAMIDRLTLTKARIEAIAASVLKVAALPDPIGNGTVKTLPNGLKITKISVPLGVVGIIYEARPNVTVDAASLCIKSGNAAILRGGKEAIKSNLAFEAVIKDALEAAGLPRGCVSVLHDTSRETASELMRMNGYIDVLIPRGGAGLIKSVVANATVPVIETGAGNCHIYVDETAELDMAAEILFNAKTSRPSVCNAAEKLLVDRGIAEKFLPMAKKLLDTKSVEIRGDEAVLAILPDAVPATEEDYFTEYNDYILAVKVVDGVREAVEHINRHNTKHSEAIVTTSMSNADYFKAHIDAAAVYVNASTRFTDGEEFGLGAEIGISTQKLHARGPMGLEALTSYKYLIDGCGQVR